jgi:septal ring-binding cell division protein DamX
MGKQLRSIQLLIVAAIFSGLFLSSAVLASDYNKAVNATVSGDYDLAISIWKKLAQQGNPVAQYNLAIFYKEGYGVDSNSSESKRWYKAAAQHRLVQATSRIGERSIQPANESDIQNEEALLQSNSVSKTDPVGWVLSQNPKHYTLQLASSRSERRIKKYYEENKMQGKGGYYKKVQDGETWYFLIYGAFNSSRNASNEIEQLPEEIRKWSPWVRRLGNIQKVINQNDV